MPTFGFLAIAHFLIRIVKALWQKEAFRGLALITLFILFSGMGFYYRFEPSITTWIDAYYFTVITLTTIGYGDFSPTTPFTKFFTTLYVFVGLGNIAALIALVGEVIIEDSKKIPIKLP